MPITIDTVLLGSIVLLLIMFLAASFAKAPVVAVPLILFVELLGTFNVSAGVMVGRLHIYPEDVVTAALVAGSVLRWFQRRKFSQPFRPIVALFVLAMLGLARGAASIGVQTSVVGAREILAMLSAAGFFSTVTVTPKLLKAVRNWLMVASAILTIFAVRFWILNGFGTYATTGTRALDGLQALVLLETTIFVIVFPPFRGPTLRLVIPLVGFAMVLLSIQRTVWVATIVAVAVLIVAGNKERGSRSLATRRLFAGAAILVVVLLVAVGPTGVTSSLTAGAQQTSISGGSTFSWRIQRWSTIISSQVSGPNADLVIGLPSGTGVDVATLGTAPAHSEYVAALESTGLIGVGLLLWLYLAALTRLRRRIRLGPPNMAQVSLLFVVILALQLTYFITYSEGAIVGLMIGLSWGFIQSNPVLRTQGD